MATKKERALVTIGALLGHMTEKELVDIVGIHIGYGNMMYLASECWRDALIEEGFGAGGEFTVGPPAALVDDRRKE